MNSYLTEFVLTCSSWQEAQRIADALLEKRLVTSVESFEIKSKHWWEDHDHGIKEVKLIVRSRADNSDKIENLAVKLQRTNTKRILIAELTSR